MILNNMSKKLPIFTRTSPKAFLWTSVSVIMLIILFLFLSSPTYDNLTSKNSVTLFVPHPETHIFLNAKQVAVTSQPNEKIVVNKISDGRHTIIAAKNDYWTWARVFDFNFQNEYTATPFLLERNPIREEIMSSSETYKEIMRIFPEPQTEIVSIDEKTRAWFENNKLYFGWISDETPPRDIFCTTGFCNDTIQVVTHTNPIRNIAYYKGRNDVILYEADHAIYAVGADGQTREIFYEGKKPNLYKHSETTFYILDNERLYKYDI